MTEFQNPPGYSALALAIGRGDTRAEIDFSKRFRERIRIAALQRNAPSWLVEDVIQETLMAVLTALRQRRVRNAEALAGFVYQTTCHVISNMRRREAGWVSMESQDGSPARQFRSETPDPLVLLMDMDDKERIMRCLDGLRPDERQLLRLAFFEGMPPREIAKELHISSEQARQRKWRALKHFAQLYKQEADDDRLPDDDLPPG